VKTPSQELRTAVSDLITVVMLMVLVWLLAF
jgi:hypothetical protein